MCTPSSNHCSCLRCQYLFIYSFTHVAQAHNTYRPPVTQLCIDDVNIFKKKKKSIGIVLKYFFKSSVRSFNTQISSQQNMYFFLSMLLHNLLRVAIFFFTIDHLRIMNGTNKHGNNKMPPQTRHNNIVSEQTNGLATKSLKKLDGKFFCWKIKSKQITTKRRKTKENYRHIEWWKKCKRWPH